MAWQVGFRQVPPAQPLPTIFAPLAPPLPPDVPPVPDVPLLPPLPEGPPSLPAPPAEDPQPSPASARDNTDAVMSERQVVMARKLACARGHHQSLVKDGQRSFV